MRPDLYKVLVKRPRWDSDFRNLKIRARFKDYDDAREDRFSKRLSMGKAMRALLSRRKVLGITGMAKLYKSRMIAKLALLLVFGNRILTSVSAYLLASERSRCGVAVRTCCSSAASRSLSTLRLASFCLSPSISRCCAATLAVCFCNSFSSSAVNSK